MGLDMYAYAVEKAAIVGEPPIIETHEGCKVKLREPAVEGDVEEIHYWRKHPNLHGWMEGLWNERFDGDRSGHAWNNFNCLKVRLDEEDLNRLEEVIRSHKLPPTSGFFFGQSDDEVEDDLEFVKKAREAIAAGKVVYYDSWW